MISTSLSWNTYQFNLSRKDWQTFFLEKAIPFFQYLKQQDNEITYYIELGNHQIKVAIGSTTKHQNNWLIHLRAWERTQGISLVESFWKNSFRGGWTYPSEKNLVNPTDFYPGEEVSDIIMNLIAAQGADDHFVFSFSLSLHIAWIKARKETSKERLSAVLLKGYSWTLPKDMQAEIAAKLQAEYKDIEEELSDLYSTIMSDDADMLSDLASWLVMWKVVCKNKISNNMALYFNQEYLNEITYYQVPHLMKKQIGLSDESFLFQVYCINQLALSSRKVRY